MELFDSHLHLDDQAFARDLHDVVARAADSGVVGMVTVGTNIASSQAAIVLAERFPGVYAAVAVHPHEASDVTPKTMAELRTLATHPRVVAIGETGLDHTPRSAPLDAQRQAFVWHVRLSKDLGLPVVVHCRQAYPEVLEILRQEGAMQVVMHAFSGSPEMARQCAQQRYFLSIAGPVTFANAKTLSQVAQKVPVESLLVETDAPVLAPEPYRGRRNEPAYLHTIVHRIADLRGCPAEEIAVGTTANARRAYRVKQN